MLKRRFKPEHVCAIARSYTLPGRLENRIASRDSRVMQQDRARRCTQAGGIGVAEEGVGLLEEHTSTDPVLVDLFDPCGGHWLATLAKSPTSGAIGASMTLRVKLERSASRRRNSSSPRTVRSTLRPALL